jgi:3'-phosphoadenosine 5'-phosphosulfate sulfotransferase (PAPS reductase)/FAD synthetase
MIEQTEKTHVVSFSGGRTSAYMVWLFEQEKKLNPEMKVEYIFNDTGAEHPKTYEFINNLVKHFGIELTCLRCVVSKEKGVGTTYRVVGLSGCVQDLKPFNDVCSKYGTPNVHGRLCTDNMKTVPTRKYCRDKYGKDGFLQWFGIRIDEPKRLKIVDKQIDAFAEEKKVDRSKAHVRYLASISDFEKQDVLRFWSEMPFDLEIEEHLGNCVFCVAKGANKIALAARDEPDAAEEFIRMIDSDDIPERKNATAGKQGIYREGQTLRSIIAAHVDLSRDEITQTIRGMKREASGSCSESCDAINDLFADLD